jgi:16S rRNA (guanine966-N2)-methyltransferase
VGNERQGRDRPGRKSDERARREKAPADAVPRRKSHERGEQARQLRIIGGTWRGRRFRFPPSPQIRPTPDRVRETLFNWLGGRVSGARCLDLFAGSGALGLEALSRGAAEVVFVEQDGPAARELRSRLAEWGAGGGARVEQEDALQFLRGRAAPKPPFDIVFLDPPFAEDLLRGTAERLESGHWLSPGALIYVESAVRSGLPAVPASWTLVRAKQAGEVGYHLMARSERERL